MGVNLPNLIVVGQTIRRKNCAVSEINDDMRSTNFILFYNYAYDSIWAE